MRFTTSYQEDVVLPEGAKVRLRHIRAEDKWRICQILAGMSPRSRMLRFFCTRGDFSEAELRYLTEVDGENHVAFLAIRGDETLGVGRFVRTGSRVAEPAFAVVDHYQTRGLGRILLARLAAAARERGIERFMADVLPHNRAMLRLFRELDASVARAASPSIDSISCEVSLAH
jgi:GNAT superfamily N-acetyltransferase